MARPLVNNSFQAQLPLNLKRPSDLAVCKIDVYNNDIRKDIQNRYRTRMEYKLKPLKSPNTYNRKVPGRFEQYNLLSI